MTKYKNDQLANMKISVFLITSFTHFIFSCALNNTHESSSLCPYDNKLFRWKRNVPEYTLWRSNIEPTPEFIVKVLDEDLSTTRPKKIVAVNIQPVTRGREKIIIGGAMVTRPTTARSTMETIEYTRFVPPTTTPEQIVDGDLIVTPDKASPRLNIEQFIALLPRAKHPQRDESPPSGPQFLTRSPSVKQYAPITPVGFTRPVTPSRTSTIMKDSYNYRKAFLPQEETTSMIDDTILFPSIARTDFEEYGNDLPIEGDSSVTKIVTEYSSTTETATEATNDDELTPSTPTYKTECYTVEPLETNDISDNRKYEKDPDVGYGLFYNYDDNESNKSEINRDSNFMYLDKTQDREPRAKDLEQESDNTKLGNSMNVELTAQDYIDLENELHDSKETTVKFSNKSVSTNENLKEKFRDKSAKNCSLVKLRPLSFNSPRTLPEIIAQLKKWTTESIVAKCVDITDGNLTAMENPIYMMKVDDPTSGQILSAKQTVMIVAGIQGRDQHAVMAAMYLLYQLIERSTAHTHLLTKYRFWVIPVFNPDGYDYAMTFPHRRNWYKNLRQYWEPCKGKSACQSCEGLGIRCVVQPCYGVNLDKNFEYQWIPSKELKSVHPCGQHYAGSRQLSEVETQAFTKLLHNHRNSQIKTFLAFKEGEVLGVMYPYSHTKKKRTYDDIYRQRAMRAAAAAYSISGRPYVAGQTSQFLPLNAGGIEDWVDGHVGICNTYNIMMFRPADTANTKLATERVVNEAFAAMDTLILQSTDLPEVLKNNPVRVTITRTRSDAVAVFSNNLMLAVITFCKCFI